MVDIYLVKKYKKGEKRKKGGKKTEGYSLTY